MRFFAFHGTYLGCETKCGRSIFFYKIQRTKFRSTTRRITYFRISHRGHGEKFPASPVGKLSWREMREVSGGGVGRLKRAAVVNSPLLITSTLLENYFRNCILMRQEFVNNAFKFLCKLCA